MGHERTALVDHWLQPVVMLYRKHRAVFDAIADPEARIDRMCELNIEMQLRRVAAIPTVENAWLRGQPLRLHSWIYGIRDGLLRNLGPTIASIAGRDALPNIDERVLHPVEPTSGIRRQAIEAFSRCPLADCSDPAQRNPE